MPWKETSCMKERVKFVILAKERRMPLAALCNLFGISRETGYKWLNRYELQGLEGLKDISRKPHSNSRSTSKEVTEAIIGLRHEHPLWGAKKLAILLRERRPELKIPSISTMSEILDRNGLVKKRRSRRRFETNTKPDLSITTSNDVWCTDFKGHFLVGDGQRCHPLTLTDAHSRYLLCCESLPSEHIDLVREIYEGIFRDFGLPKIILSDNGSPFASRAPGGLTRLSAWWVKLGITPVRIVPGHPEQNGRHERMHRTLKAATAYPAQSSLKAQQKAFNSFKDEYNTLRPHEALGQMRPAELYQSSSRPFPEKIGDPSYPANFDIRNVRQNGEIKWKGKRLFISEVLMKESIGLEEVADETRLIYFCHLPIALLDERKGAITILPSRLKLNRLSAMSSD
jgi:transposase InsO family protein